MKLKGLFKLRVRVVEKHERVWEYTDGYGRGYSLHYIGQYRKWWWPKWSTLTNKATLTECDKMFGITPTPILFKTEQDALQALDIIVRYN